MQDLVERRLERMVEKHAEYREAVTRVWEVLAKYRVPENKWLTDSLFQEQEDRKPRDIDLLFYSELMFQLLRGHLFYTGIDVRCPPAEKPEDALLNEITLAAVEPPFEFVFANGNGMRQPMLAWHEPVIVHSHRKGLADTTRQLKPGRTLLTIGHIRASDTGLALNERGSIARWPFGHSFVYLLWTDLPGLFDGISDLSDWFDERL